MGPLVANHTGKALDEDALYELLGDAWNDQFGEPWFLDADQRDANYLGSPGQIGRREFAALVPALRKDLLTSCPHEVVAVTQLTIMRSSQWQMPSDIVAALAVHHGLVSSNVIEIFKRQ